MKKLNFEKYQGTGNDFILVDLLTKDFDYNYLANDTNYVKKLCNRNYGIGADGVIFILPPQKDGDAYMKIINADGSIPEMCGNGIRCLVRYIEMYTTIDINSNIVVETLAGNIEASIEKDRNIKVNMGIPIFDNNVIPTYLKSNSNGVPFGQVVLGESQFDIYAASMGNPHLILFHNSSSDIPILEWGPILEKDPRFPNKTNVHFVRIIDRDKIAVKVWERGAGITLACGTGACAIVAVTSKLDLCDNKVNVNLPGGQLLIHWPNKNGNIYMTGSAEHVFSGTIEV